MSTFGHDEPDLCVCGQRVDHKEPCLLRLAGKEFKKLERGGSGSFMAGDSPYNGLDKPPET